MSSEKLLVGFRLLDERPESIIRRGSVILASGPPLSGKRIFAKRFAYAGLQSGECCIFTCTNNPAEEERREFAEYGMDVSEFESAGTMAYIDFYSRGAGIKCDETELIKRVASLMDLTGYNVALRDLLTKFWRMEKPIRIVFDSLSTLLLYNDARTVTRFLHMMLGKLRSVNATSLLVLEEGAHPPEILTIIKSMANALIEFKEDERGAQYLRVRSESAFLDWMPYAALAPGLG